MTCSILIVWLDSNADDPHSSFYRKITQGGNEKIERFTDIDSCVTFIRKHCEEKIFLILSASFGSKVVPLVYQYENLIEIYLFCASIATHANWAMDYVDKMLMFDHEDDLLQRLNKEIEQYFRQQAEQYLDQANICQQRAQQLKQKPCG